MKTLFSLPLLSPFTIFPEERRRLGSVKLENSVFVCHSPRLSLSLTSKTNYEILASIHINTAGSRHLPGREGTRRDKFVRLSQHSHLDPRLCTGGTNISVIDEDVNLINQNPALLGPESDLQLGLNYMKYVGGINLAGATFAKAAGERGAWAAGIQYYGYGKMKSADETGVITGEFSPKDIVFNGIYSHDFNSFLRGGINAKVIYSSYEQYTSWALAVDLGLNYYNADNDLSLSLVARNLGGQIKRYNETFERMPFDLQIGYTQSLQHAPIRVSVTARHLTRWKLPYPTIENNAYTSGDAVIEKSGFVDNLFRHLIFGVEYLPTDRLYFGLGYNYKPAPT